MKRRELINLGFPGTAIGLALEACAAAARAGQKGEQIRENMRALLADPQSFADDPAYGLLANALLSREPESPPYSFRDDLTYAVWGDDIDPEAHKQMRNACRLPVSVAGALMPDAHLGYGLPIGGVLATENAVIPYAVGVDIACRVKLTVLDVPPDRLGAEEGRFEHVLNDNTLFGVGGQWPKPQTHAVMDEDWAVTPVTKELKDIAWRQLGSSGSGNHFVEFGDIEFGPNRLGIEPGRYLGLVSHSGSRGPGSRVADHYSRLARDLHPGLPKDLAYLAWLPMDGAGAEYWAAMELMGRFASANHAVIHDRVTRAVGARVIYGVENHHNFAWREQHSGRELIVHRKGATPAGAGVLGYIPGSMAAPGYLVEGLGDPSSLHSASHGAGRRLSRTKARETTRWSHVKRVLAERGVKLISAGLDESPHAYKDIEAVMNAQAALVRRVARFMPRLVKMAPDGEPAED